MRKSLLLITVLILLSSIVLAQEERKVLVEVFTNSHCGLCPNAHSIIDDYLSEPNGDRINYIYYHMVYPYSDDILYQQSMVSSDARDDYYNPIESTPRGFFDGVPQGSSSGWSATLDNLISTNSPMKIDLTGSINGNEITINTSVTRTGNVTDSDLRMHFVIVEDVMYNGRNGLSNHKHVMRKMLPSPSGLPFSVNLNETKKDEITFNVDALWDASMLSVVVFIQSAAGLTAYQSETISYNDLAITKVENDNSVPNELSLEQNYPNPFNPTTIIRFSIPSTTFVQLKVYNVLGNEIATIVNKEMPAGNYSVEYDASILPSGIYFYTLTTNNFSKTRKMTLVK